MLALRLCLAVKGTNHIQKATPQGVLRHSQSQKQTNLHQRVVRGAAYYLLIHFVKLLRLQQMYLSKTDCDNVRHSYFITLMPNLTRKSCKKYNTCLKLELFSQFINYGFLN